MALPLSRRHFVTTCSAGALAGLGDLDFLGQLPAAAPAVPRTVQFDADTEPLVRLIEDTPREGLLGEVATRIKSGLPYQQLLTALFLAGVRGIQPRPVGFKFHAVMVINSAHLASLAAEDRDRWLPLFWALDNFKGAQARNKAEGDWRLPPVPADRLPPAHQARARFTEAMEAWDEAAADAAAVSLVRSCPAAEVFEPIWQLCARDFRDIGHKVIYAAGAWRTLQVIGWQHAEPVVRSLAYALLMHDGKNPAKNDLPADRPGRENSRLAARPGGAKRGDGEAVSRELLRTLRTGSPADGSAFLHRHLAPEGTRPLWDGLFLNAAELLARQPGIVGIHCVTTLNALYAAAQATGDERTRRFLLLQGGAFLPLFRDAMAGRGKLGAFEIDKLEPVRNEPGRPGGREDAVGAIFADMSSDRTLAARRTLGLLQSDPGQVNRLMAQARRLVFAKGRDSHDYKFSSAALEDYHHISPGLRERYLAACTFNLRSSSERDTDLLRRTREALKG